MIILDGRLVSQKILDSIKSEISQSQKMAPNLDIILVGDDPSSLKYVTMKNQKANLAGIGGQIHKLPSQTNDRELLDLIDKLNNDSSVTGFMIQLPLPSHLNQKKALLSIDPKKDVDGLNPINLGLLYHHHPQAIAAATSLGIIKLLEHYQIDLGGKNAVIIGRSVEVALPLQSLLLSRNATVTVCHSQTQNLPSICQTADILISSIGKPKFITAEYIKKDAVIIDVGQSVDPVNNQVVGDVDFDSVSQLAQYITPVPGGVGPMTIACLLLNTFDVWQRNL